MLVHSGAMRQKTFTNQSIRTLASKGPVSRERGHRVRGRARHGRQLSWPPRNSQSITYKPFLSTIEQFSVSCGRLRCTICDIVCAPQRAAPTKMPRAIWHTCVCALPRTSGCSNQPTSSNRPQHEIEDASRFFAARQSRDGVFIFFRSMVGPKHYVKNRKHRSKVLIRKGRIGGMMNAVILRAGEYYGEATKRKPIIYVLYITPKRHHTIDLENQRVRLKDDENQWVNESRSDQPLGPKVSDGRSETQRIVAVM